MKTKRNTSMKTPKSKTLYNQFNYEVLFFYIEFVKTCLGCEVEIVLIDHIFIQRDKRKTQFESTLIK